jgi:hypothetical protein
MATTATTVPPMPPFPWEGFPKELLTRFPEVDAWQKRLQQKLALYQKQTQVAVDQRISALDLRIAELEKEASNG